MDGGDHAVLFPFMSKGHTIPILHVARLLCRRQMSVTVITTPANLNFIAQSLSDTSARILPLPFPTNIPGVPEGVESTDKLPDMSLYVAFTTATESMQPHFEQTLRTLSDVSFIVSDGFLWWTQDSADRLGIPRVSFYGMGGFASTVSYSVMSNWTVLEHRWRETELVGVPDFPWVKVRKSDFDPQLTDREPDGPFPHELMTKQIEATTRSYGMIFNSFYEMEPVFADYWNRKGLPGWWVGPLCLSRPLNTQVQARPWWAEWLDNQSSVLYVAFGSQAKISPEQLKKIAMGLERSDVSFMWVTRADESELPQGYNERVKGRGVIVREWVEQTEILAHERVRGFLSHCGWNSVMESVCAGVPILAWPMMAEQPLNARMVVEEIKIGLRVESGDNGMVNGEELANAVKELMEGEKGKEARKAVKKYAEEAKRAVEEEGSSWRALGELLDDIKKTRESKV